MSGSIESLRHKINSAGELESVVRTMKALAASSIGQYERAVLSLQDYYRTVQLGLAACLSHGALDTVSPKIEAKKIKTTEIIIFGSDQGLVGQFNDLLANFALKTLHNLSEKKTLKAVGERMYLILNASDLKPQGMFQVPNSVNAITALVSDILLQSQGLQNREETEFYIFHNQPIRNGIYEPVKQRLLPFDEKWIEEITAIPWPVRKSPQIIDDTKTLTSLIREYLFTSLFKACAESLNSENASRMLAMQRAEKNITELLEGLKAAFNQERQNSIDEELFDVIAGFEALKKTSK